MRKEICGKQRKRKETLCDRDCPSLFLITATFQSTWRHQNQPPRLPTGQTAERKTGSDACRYQEKYLCGAFRCLCVLNVVFDSANREKKDAHFRCVCVYSGLRLFITQLYSIHSDLFIFAMPCNRIHTLKQVFGVCLYQLRTCR